MKNSSFRFSKDLLKLFWYICACLSVILSFALDGSLIEVDLKTHEQKIYSQNGEDGVLNTIFNLIGKTSGFFVEFGVENGKECNTRFFRRYYGWKGLMLDLSYENRRIGLFRERVTAENIVALFQKYLVPAEFDLLSIDIDFNDFHVWHALAPYYRPRVVVIEYNGCHLPDEDKVVIYDPDSCWDKTNYFGASILAYYKLARKYGYSLVYAENRGVNLFFIRDDVLESSNVIFINTNNVEKIYKPPYNVGNGPNGGNIPDPLNREYVKSEDLLKANVGLHSR